MLKHNFHHSLGLEGVNPKINFPEKCYVDPFWHKTKGYRSILLIDPIWEVSSKKDKKQKQKQKKVILKLQSFAHEVKKLKN